MAARRSYHSEHATVYTDGFEPLSWKEKKFNLIRRKQKQIMKPPLNISEQEQLYQVEMTVPGFKKEDFFVYTDGTKVNISKINTVHLHI